MCISERNYINRTVSFSRRHFRLLQIADANGYDRSNTIRIALDLLHAQRPEFFLPASDINVENNISIELSEKKIA